MRIKKLIGLAFNQLCNFDPKKHLESDVVVLKARDLSEATLEEYKNLQF